MSKWDSKYAIKCDLSVAQSRIVPGSLHTGTLYPGEKPPSLKITEETEEEYFDHCPADVATSKPNYNLIKQMLDMVRGENISDDEDNEKIGIINKPNPESAEFIPKNNSTPLPPEPVIIKRQKRKNVALESILQAIENKEKLGEGKDTVKQEQEVENKETIPHEVVKKVNGWLETQNAVITTKLPKKKTATLNLEVTNMFKKKNTKEKVQIVEKTVTLERNQTNQNFQPGSLAQEYYQKFLERSKLKEAVKVDIWVKAEEKMKEIDERRKLEATCTQELPSTSTSPQESDNDTKSDPEILNEKALKMIALPQHRHQLLEEDEDCVVCKVLTKET